MRRVLALHLTTFLVDRIRREQLASGERATLLVVETVNGVQRIVEGSAGARSRGVTTGMTLAHARALLGDVGGESRGVEANGKLRIVEHDPARDREVLERLGAWGMRFSPLVAAAPPDVLLFDLTGSERSMGPEETQRERIAGGYEALGFRARAAVADTIGCAWALACHGREACLRSGDEKEALAPLPVRALRLEKGTLDALFEVGIERIGHLFDLRRDELPARFRSELLLRIDQALGTAFEPFVPIRLPAPPRRTHVFEEPVGLELVTFVARRLLGDLGAELRERGEGTRRLEVRLRCAQADPAELIVSLTRPTCDDAHLWKLLEPRLERVSLGFGAEHLALEMPITAPLPMHQAAAFGERGTRRALDRHLGELLDNLIGRLGPARVRRVETLESHVPERAFVTRPLLDASHVARGPASLHGTERSNGRARRDERSVTPHARPTRLFDPPHPIDVRTTQAGTPTTFRLQGRALELSRVLGPERVTPPWWRDDTGRERDYYRVQDETGRWFWLARVRAGAAREPGRWFLHGEWA